jgi:group I intron endonuclease
MTGSIYIITNIINDKVYIGKTYNNLETRFREHLRDSRKSNKNSKLYKAIRKYGFENFEISVLEHNINEGDLENLEIFYISKYNSYKFI